MHLQNCIATQELLAMRGSMGRKLYPATAAATSPHLHEKDGVFDAPNAACSPPPNVDGEPEG